MRKLDMTTRWHCGSIGPSSSTHVAGANTLCDRNIDAEERGPESSSLISDVTSSSSLCTLWPNRHQLNEDLLFSKMCPRRWTGGGSRGPRPSQNSVSPGESCFYVHACWTLRDWPSRISLTGQDPPLPLEPGIMGQRGRQPMAPWPNVLTTEAGLLK